VHVAEEIMVVPLGDPVVASHLADASLPRPGCRRRG
jgi:hypothetical protein